MNGRHTAVACSRDGSGKRQQICHFQTKSASHHSYPLPPRQHRCPGPGAVTPTERKKQIIMKGSNKLIYIVVLLG